MNIVAFVLKNNTEVFISGNNDEAVEDGTWYVTTPCQSFSFTSYNDMKTIVDLFDHNKIS